MCEWLCGWLEPANLIQFAIAVGLGFYAWDTRKIRKLSQEQIEVMQKPCLVPNVRARTHRVVGEVSDDITYHGVMTSGNVTLHNIGNGTAFNIRLEIQKQEEPKESSKGYMPFLPAGSEAMTSIVTNELYTSKQHEKVKLKLSYVSQSGKSYESAIQVQPGNTLLIVTDISFD